MLCFAYASAGKTLGRSDAFVGVTLEAFQDIKTRIEMVDPLEA
jgi:hypothetical protein